MSIGYRAAHSIQVSPQLRAMLINSRSGQDCRRVRMDTFPKIPKGLGPSGYLSVSQRNRYFIAH